MAVQSVRMVTANMLLSVFFLSGALDADPSVTELFMTAPQEMEALSGSCLQIPCNFSAKSENRFNSTRTTYGLWIKDTVDFANNPNDVIFNSSRVDNTYPMNLTGDLSQQNCTTLFSSLITTYTATYYFRMENGPFVATADRDPLKITVNDSPPSPSIEISGVLKEKESVSISCSALTPCPHSPPKLTWNLLDPHNIIEENTDRTFTTKIQKNFTLSDKHDGLNITCSASYPVNEGKDFLTAEQNKTLNVSYAPKDTSASISPLGQVSAGSWVNLTCSSRANPPVSSFTWFKNSKDGPVNVSEGDVYSFNVTDGGVYYCVAINGLGNERSSEVHITIEGGKDNPQELAAVVGGTIGLIVLIGLVVCVWRLKSTHQTAQQSQNLTVEETASVPEEDIHYGEINFSRRGPELSLASVQDSGEHQDTLYTQVKVSKTAKNATQTDDVPEDLYAKVKK